jgi:hypothetical protein
LLESELLRWILAVEAVVLVVLLLFLAVRSLLFALVSPRRDERVRKASSDLIHAVETDSDLPSKLADLGLGEQIDALFPLLPSLSGERLAKLTAIAGETGVTNWARRRCESRRWYRRTRGARVLSALEADGPVLELLGDRDHDVRVLAAEWASKQPSPRVIEELCTSLGDRDPGVRFEATDSLLRIGGAAVEPVAEVVNGDRDERSTVAALRAAAGIGDPRLALAAERRTADPRPGVRAAAASACGTLGGSSATVELERLLADPEDQVRMAAVDALGRIANWPSAPLVAARLGDESWAVRRQAARALGEFGAVGRLYLRRTAEAGEGEASAVARQALRFGATA